MIDLTRKSLPNTIEVNGRLFSVYTDFRVWMKFEISLSQHRGASEIPVDYLFKNRAPLYCTVSDLLPFARPSNPLPKKVRGMADDDVIALDYSLDSDLIYAAFLQQYGIDLVDIPELHWHKFLALLRGLKNTKLDEVMSYRCYVKQTNKNIDPYEEMRDAWSIDPPLSEEEKAKLEAFSKTFGGE